MVTPSTRYSPWTLATVCSNIRGILKSRRHCISFRINPLTDVGAKEMISSLKSYPLLTGFRGAPPVDLGTVEETLLRLSQLVRDFDCFHEIDINPFIASPDKARCIAVDARFIFKQ